MIEYNPDQSMNLLATLSLRSCIVRGIDYKKVITVMNYLKDQKSCDSDIIFRIVLSMCLGILPAHTVMITQDDDDLWSDIVSNLLPLDILIRNIVEGAFS